jgi:formyltetrahydrofolate synthetase
MSNGIIGVFVGDDEVRYCTDVNGEISVLMSYNVFKQLSDNSSYKISNNSEKHLKVKDESIKKVDSLDTNKRNLYKRLDDLDKKMLKLEKWYSRNKTFEDDDDDEEN